MPCKQGKSKNAQVALQLIFQGLVGGRDESDQNMCAYKDAEREAGKKHIVIRKGKAPVRKGLRSDKGYFPQCLITLLF